MMSEMLYNYVTCFKNAFSISGDLRLSCVQISLISDTGPIFAIREPCPLHGLTVSHLSDQTVLAGQYMTVLLIFWMTSTLFRL